MKEILFNPFKKIAGLQALIIGLCIILISAFLASHFGLRYDGAIDAHFIAGKVNFTTSLIEQIVNIICISFFLYLAAITSGARRTRPIDMIGTIALSRFPYMFIPLLNMSGVFSDLSESMLNMNSQEDAAEIFQNVNMVWLSLFSLVLIVLLVWAIALFFNAYKVSTNLKGIRLIMSFIFGLLIAEITSIYIIRTLL